MFMNTRKWMLTILIIIILLFLYRVRIILTPFLFAALIAYMAYPLVKVFERRQVPRSIAIVLVYLIFAAIFGILISFMIPQLAKEVDELLKTLPEQTEMLEDGLERLRKLQNISVPDVLQAGFDTLVNQIQRLLEGLAERIAGILVGLVSQIVSMAIAPILAFYLLRDLEVIKRRTFMLIPKRYRLTIYTLTKEMNGILNGFIRGQLVNAAVVGLLIQQALPY